MNGEEGFGRLTPFDFAQDCKKPPPLFLLAPAEKKFLISFGSFLCKSLRSSPKKNNPTLCGYFFGLAGEEGFEPPNGGFKARCLTTWRLPMILIYFSFPDAYSPVYVILGILLEKEQTNHSKTKVGLSTIPNVFS